MAAELKSHLTANKMIKNAAQQVLSTAETEETIRLTVDMPASLHRRFSLLAVQQNKSKAELVRMAITQLLQDMERDLIG